LRQSCDKTAKQIEENVTYVPEAVFDVITEQKEEPHVADEVIPTGVQEHGREHSRDRVGTPIEHLRHDAPGIKIMVELDWLHCEFVQKNKRTYNDEQRIDQRRRFTVNGVFEWKHSTVQPTDAF
jgi:hypothetical protein